MNGNAALLPEAFGPMEVTSKKKPGLRERAGFRCLGGRLTA